MDFNFKNNKYGSFQNVNDYPLEDRGWQRQQRMRRLDGTLNSMHMSLSKLPEIVKERETWQVESMGLQRVVHDLATERQQQILLKSLTKLKLPSSEPVIFGAA